MSCECGDGAAVLLALELGLGRCVALGSCLSLELGRSVTVVMERGGLVIAGVEWGWLIVWIVEEEFAWANQAVGRRPWRWLPGRGCVR